MTQCALSKRNAAWIDQSDRGVDYDVFRLLTPPSTFMSIRNHSAFSAIVPRFFTDNYERANQIRKIVLSCQNRDGTARYLFLKLVTGTSIPTASMMFPAVRFAYIDLTNPLPNKIKEGH